MTRGEIMWAEKARSDWIIQGDRNTRYFQTVVKQRGAQNRILHLKTAYGNTIEELEEIESTLVEHFKNQHAKTDTK